MTVHAKALHRAAEIVGGREKLRTLLEVSVSELEAWMAGAERPPMQVFLKAVDIISAAPQRSNEIQAAILAERDAAGRPRGASALAFLHAKFEPAEGKAMVETALEAALASTGAVMEKARARAVQSTPLKSRSGQLLGVLSSVYHQPHQPDERELDIIDHIARRTAFWLDGGAL